MAKIRLFFIIFLLFLLLQNSGRSIPTKVSLFPLRIARSQRVLQFTERGKNFVLVYGNYSMPVPPHKTFVNFLKNFYKKRDAFASHRFLLACSNFRRSRCCSAFAAAARTFFFLLYINNVRLCKYKTRLLGSCSSLLCEFPSSFTENFFVCRVPAQMLPFSAKKGRSCVPRKFCDL